jgi:hypothetical protein
MVPALTKAEDSILVFAKLSWLAKAEQLGKLAPVAALSVVVELD